MQRASVFKLLAAATFALAMPAQAQNDQMTAIAIPAQPNAIELLTSDHAEMMGDHFALGDFHGRELGDGLGIEEAELLGVVLDGVFQAIAHELEIAQDRAGGDFELLGERAAVGEAA